MHYSPGCWIRCRSNPTFVFRARFVPGNRNTVGEQLSLLLESRKRAFLIFLSQLFPNIINQQMSMISLHRRQVDTLPTRRWWQNTGGLKSVCISRVTFCRSISGSNIFSLGLMCVFLPKWQMGVRNPPPRAQTPPPPPLLCHRGLPSVL